MRFSEILNFDIQLVDMSEKDPTDQDALGVQCDAPPELPIPPAPDQVTLKPQSHIFCNIFYC